MTPPGNHILPHYDAALNAIRTRVNAVCGSLLKHMDVLERVISGPDSDGANGIIADGEPLNEETRQVLSLCAAVLTQFHSPGVRPAACAHLFPLRGQAPGMHGGSHRHRQACQGHPSGARNPCARI